MIMCMTVGESSYNKIAVQTKDFNSAQSMSESEKEVFVRVVSINV